MTTSFELSLAAVDLLGERLGVDPRVAPFDIPHHGVTVADRERLGDSVLRDLESRGLAYRGRLEPEIEDALMLLARAPIAATLMLVSEGGGPAVRARAASNGRIAGLAIAHELTLTWTFVRPTALVAALLSVIPDASPIGGPSVTFPRDEPAGPSADPDAPITVLQPVRRTGHGVAREAARRMLARPKIRVGVIVLSSRDQHGGEQRGEPILWFDTDGGRFTSQAKATRNGAVWETYSPADNQLLGQLIAEELATFG